MPSISYHDFAIRYAAANYLKRWIGIVFDRNEIIHEVLQAFGVEERGYACSIHELYLNHKEKKIENRNPYPGCLVFWLKNGKAVHVEMVTEIIDGFIYTIGVPQGTIEQTRAHIKQNSINYRGANYKVADPFLKGV